MRFSEKLPLMCRWDIPAWWCHMHSILVVQWKCAFWRKSSCFNSAMIRTQQTPVCAWVTFISPRSESWKWAPPPRQPSSVTAHALKASFIPSDGNYLCSWLILPSCTLFQSSTPHKCQHSPLKTYIPSSYIILGISFSMLFRFEYFQAFFFCFCLDPFLQARAVTWWVSSTPPLPPPSACVGTLISSCQRQRGNDAADLSADDCLESHWGSAQLISVWFLRGCVM